MNEQPAAGGRPRLVVVPAGGHASTDGPEAQGYEVEYPLGAGRTTIGSDAGQDIVLEGVAPAQAVIEWQAAGDEFVFTPLATDGSTTVDGEIATTGIHHGDRLQLGPWTLVFQRDELADHIRNGRARKGGQWGGPGGHRTETEGGG